MEKAFDVVVLVGGLKADGLDIAEDGAKKVVQRVFEWVEKSIQLTPSLVDDIALGVIPQVKKVVLEQIDKIDGQVG